MLFGEYDATLEEEKANLNTDRMMKTPIVHALNSPSPVTLRVSKQQSSKGSPHTANRIDLFKQVGHFEDSPKHDENLDEQNGV